MWIKLGLNQNSSSTNEKLADLETDLLGDWPGDLSKRLLRGYTFFKFLWGRVVRRWWVDAQCPQMSVDILGTSCDQCWSMVQYSFTSMDTRRLVRMDSWGRTAEDSPLDSHTAPELWVWGLKWSVFYTLKKYGIGGPEFGIKEEFVTE